jgi:hypothetical protein
MEGWRRVRLETMEFGVSSRPFKMLFTCQEKKNETSVRCAWRRRRRRSWDEKEEEELG